jgi:hypothetical protein
MRVRCAADVKTAIRVANGNSEEALELLLTGAVAPSADVAARHNLTNSDVYMDSEDSDDDALVTVHEYTPAAKRVRQAADGSRYDSEPVPAAAVAHQVPCIGHIFVDQSNIGAAEADIPAFDWIISKDLSSYHERVVVGSQTELVGRGRHERAWKALGYCAHFQQKRANQPESFVDETLVAHVQRALLQHSPEGRIIILATGALFCTNIAFSSTGINGHCAQVMATPITESRTF